MVTHSEPNSVICCFLPLYLVLKVKMRESKGGLTILCKIKVCSDQLRCFMTSHNSLCDLFVTNIMELFEIITALFNDCI